MKRIVVFLVVCLLFAACVPTPETEFVINKSEIETDEVLLHTAPPVESNADAQRVTLAEQLGAPKHWSEDAFSRKVPYDTLTVSIDADVNVPDTDCVGVYTATFDVPFSEAQQKSLILKYLGENERPFVLPDGNSYWRKWQLEEQIRYLQQQMTEHDKIEDPSLRDHMLANDNERLQTQMERYRKAPEDWTHGEWDGKYASGSGFDAQGLLLYANTEQFAHYRELSIDAYHFGYGDETQTVYEIDAHQNTTGYLKMQSPVRQAAKNAAEKAAADLALAEVNALGVGTYTVKCVMQGSDVADSDVFTDGCYIVRMFLTSDGIPCYDLQTRHGFDNVVARAYKDKLLEEPDYGNYMPGQGYAQVSVNNGKIASIAVYGLQKIGSCINENVRLLPFDDVLKTFRDQIFYHCVTGDPDDPDSGKGETIHITQIYFSVMRIRKKDALNEFCIVPVWDFTGYVKRAGTAMTPDETEREIASSSGLSFLTINAVDGSVIDRDKGY